MTVSNIQPILSNDQLAELEKVARSEDRTLNEVVIEAVDRYIKEKQWEALKRYGRAKSEELGLTEDDVPRLIAKSRQELGR